MELREQIAEKIDKLAYGETRNPHFIADEIISSSILENWTVEEKCPECVDGRIEGVKDSNGVIETHVCFKCGGHNNITRPAKLEDLEREDVRLRKK